MDNRIIEWLLEGPDWLKYAVETQLLESKPDVIAVLQDASIRRIMHRLKDEKVGVPGLKTGKVTWENTGNAYWDLFFLADIGLTVDDLELREEMEEFLQRQLPDGTFITEDDHAPNYFCVSAIFLSSVAKIGYQDDPRISKCVKYILDTQRLDGGWHCADDHAVGQELQHAESCPMDNLNILQLLGHYEEHRKDSRFDGAVDLLLEHWRRRDEKWRPGDFGIGKRFMALEYPARKYGILRVLDALSPFPHALKGGIFEDMLNFVRQKSSGGRYTAESVPDAYPEFDFGQKEEPSRWITFVISRIEKRLSEESGD